MVAMNVFRIIGDCLHLSSKCILIFSIHRNRSAEGVSLITQVLYAMVFCTRYLNLLQDLFKWNIFFKIFYITTSFYIIAMMRWVYPRSRELELAWKMGGIITAGSLLLSPFGMMIFVNKAEWGFMVWLWSFSEILESVAVLPQLLLLRQTTIPTVIDSYYLLALGCYRGFYILNWIERAADPDDQLPNHLSIVFGIIQTLLYLDFAWVYWTRQRVKLRNGGVVDADDIRHGWLLSRIFGKHMDHGSRGGADDEESAPALGGPRRSAGQTGSKWGARGISVSADDATLEQEHLFAAERSDGHHNLDASVDPDARMQDPDDLARALDAEEDDDGDDDDDEEEEDDDDDDEDDDEDDDDDDDDDDDEDDAPPPPSKNKTASAGGVRNDEWDD